MDKRKLLEKWLSDDLNEQERIAFDASYDSSFHKKIADDAVHFKASNFSVMPDFETFKKKIGQVNHSPKRFNWFSPVLKIASIIVVAFGIYYFANVEALTTIDTFKNEKTSVSLPDTSKVILNALSQISYAQDDWGSNRKVELKGEAFFDVAKGKTFDVVTSDGTISVLGTEFNVKQRSGYLEVTCYEGTVRVKTEEHTKILTAGDNFRVYKGEAVSDNHQRKTPDWINDKSYFERIPLVEVILELERQYDVEVETESIDTDQLFTGGFVHSNLESALEQISTPLQLKYDILNPKLVRFVMSE